VCLPLAGPGTAEPAPAHLGRRGAPCLSRSSSSGSKGRDSRPGGLTQAEGRSCVRTGGASLGYGVPGASPRVWGAQEGLEGGWGWGWGWREGRGGAVVGAQDPSSTKLERRLHQLLAASEGLQEERRGEMGARGAVPRCNPAPQAQARGAGAGAGSRGGAPVGKLRERQRQQGRHEGWVLPGPGVRRPGASPGAAAEGVPEREPAWDDPRSPSPRSASSRSSSSSSIGSAGGGGGRAGVRRGVRAA